MDDPRPSPKVNGPARIAREDPVAYFCAEFGVHNSLPLYSGGLGILAGDHLKSASDLNLPLVAVGLLYRFGYFRQRMSREDWQEEQYRENHIDELALNSVDDAQGRPLLIQVPMGGPVGYAPVAAGHDEFDSALVEKGLGDWPQTALGVSQEEFLKLGRVNGDSNESFGLTPLALRMCRSTNGVSQKHGEVSRELWHKMWKDRPVEQVPITSLTNGVHPSTWVAPLLRRLYEESVGEDWVDRARGKNVWAYGIDKLSDEQLWKGHLLLKQRLVAFIRDHSFDARLARGESEEHIESARTMFDPKVLTIGFARRVAGYKRWDLLLSDPDRLTTLINDAERPIQFVFAGKAHPQDEEAKRILQKLLDWHREPAVCQRVTFIEDYDQEIARQMVQGVDVWMNVPRRPMEASGTSGQKVAINGGLNFSVLDGWWLEGYDGDNGFAIGDLSETSEAEMDRLDAESMYRVLTDEVIPRFYERDDAGIPRRWVAMMKQSIQTLVPQFSSDRMVAEYVERIY